MYKYLILLGCCWIATAQAQTNLTLDECFEIAIRNNPQIRQAERQVDLGINAVQQTKFTQLPSVSGVWNQGYNLGRTIDPYSNDVVTNQIGTNNMGARADWVLFNGFQQKNLLAQYALQLNATQSDLEAVKNNLKLHILLAYMQVLTADELLETAQNQTQSTALKVEKIEKMVRLNVVAESNLFDIRAQLSIDKFQVTNAQNNFRLAKLKLQQLLNLPFEKSLSFEKIDLKVRQYEANPQSAFDWASTQFPEVKAAQTRLQVQQKAVSLVEGLRYPTIALNGAWGTAYSSSQKTSYFEQLGNNHNLSFGLSIRLPIFNTTQQKYKLQQARIQQQLAKYEVENTQTQLRQAIEQAFIEKNNAQDRAESVAEQLMILEKSLQAAEAKLMGGLINPTDYSIHKMQYEKAKIEAIQAKYEYFFRMKIVEFYEGK